MKPYSSRRSSRQGSPIMFEPIERRTLMSASSWVSDSISDLSGSEEFATIQFGDNGYPYGVATAIAGQNDNQEAWSYTEWDTSGYDDLDSGWRGVNFSVNATNNGTASFSVDGDSPTMYSVGTGNSIHAVTVTADAAYGGVEFDWEGITVNFYHNGALVDSQQANSLSAGSTTSTSWDSSESGITFKTSAQNVNGMSFQGMARLASGSGIYPGENDVFGRVVVT